MKNEAFLPALLCWCCWTVLFPSSCLPANFLLSFFYVFYLLFFSLPLVSLWFASPDVSVLVPRLLFSFWLLSCPWLRRGSARQVANQSAVSQEQVDNILQENDALRTNLAALEQVNIVQMVAASLPAVMSRNTNLWKIFREAQQLKPINEVWIFILMWEKHPHWNVAVFSLYL